MKTETQYRGIEHTALSRKDRRQLDAIVHSLKGRTIVNVVFSDAVGSIMATLLLDDGNYIDVSAPSLGLDMLGEGVPS